MSRLSSVPKLLDEVSFRHPILELVSPFFSNLPVGALGVLSLASVSSWGY